MTEQTFNSWHKAYTEFLSDAPFVRLTLHALADDLRGEAWSTVNEDARRVVLLGIPSIFG